MNPIGYARSREYWTRFGCGTLMSLVGAAVPLITGTTMVNAIPVLATALIAHFVFNGTVLSNPTVAGQRCRDIAVAL